VIAIFCLCGVLIFVAVRYQRLMKITENLDSTEERMIQIYNADHNTEQKSIELDDDPIRNDAVNITQGNTRGKIESNKDVNIRFALNKLSSNKSGSCSTPGNIEIGPQDSAL